MANICDTPEDSQVTRSINLQLGLAFGVSHGRRIDEEAPYDDISICPAKVKIVPGSCSCRAPPPHATLLLAPFPEGQEDAGVRHRR